MEIERGEVSRDAGQAMPLRQKKPPERTASKAVRQHQLIEATIVEIAERGLSSFKLSDVAKTAGVAVGMVNFHFTTKAQLLDLTNMKPAGARRWLRRGMTRRRACRR
jgi:hypothetical protein